MPRIWPQDLQQFAESVLGVSGLAAADSRAAAEGLVSATMRGVSTHGIFRLPQYSDCLRRGVINTNPQVRVLARRGATALVDADGGYGYLPGALGMDLAVEIAGQHGVAVVGVRNSHHFGAAAIYTLRAAEAQMIGLATTTTKARIAPTGGVAPVVGNNPISVAVPRRAPHRPIALDMAISNVALGKVRMAAAAGHEVPEGWGYDSSGRPTRDPHSIIDGGLLAPIGAHKGYGLSVIAEVLAGVLTGSPFALSADNHDRPDGGVGHFLLAVDPFFLRDRDDFYDDVERLVEQIKAVPAAEGGGVYVPGEIEEKAAADNAAQGVVVADGLASRLERLAAELAIEPPAWDAAVAEERGEAGEEMSV